MEHTAKQNVSQTKGCENAAQHPKTTKIMSRFDLNERLSSGLRTIGIHRVGSNHPSYLRQFLGILHA